MSYSIILFSNLIFHFFEIIWTLKIFNSFYIFQIVKVYKIVNYSESVNYYVIS